MYFDVPKKLVNKYYIMSCKKIQKQNEFYFVRVNSFLC